MRIVPTLAISAVLLAGGTVAYASPGSGEGAITDVVGVFQLVHADGTYTSPRVATPDEGPDGSGIRLRRGERVFVIGQGSSCLDPATQLRHNAAVDHQADCGVTPEGVPASWAR